MGGNGKAIQSAYKRPRAKNCKSDFLPKEIGIWLRFSFEELPFMVLDFSSGAVGNKLTKREEKKKVKQYVTGHLDTAKL